MLYADVYVNEPIEKVIDDWDFLDERVVSKFSSFRAVGDNVYGLHPLRFDSQGHAKGPLQMSVVRRLLQLGPNGVSEVPRSCDMSTKVICAGTPHHLEGLVGYWHINDKDEVSLMIPPGRRDAGCIILIMPRAVGNETDRFAWYCEQCTSLVFMREVVTGRDGFQKFWPAERAAVREYNGNAKNRTCWNCGHINPIGYVAFYAQDTPAEHEARLSW
jgi:hypothetical protein